MAELPEIPGVHELAGEDDERKEQRFTRLVAMAIVLVTLAAATTAYLQASAESVRDAANAHATTLASEAQAAGATSGQAAQALVDRFDVAEQQRGQAAFAQQQAFFGPSAGRAALLAEQRRWLTVAGQTDEHTRSIAAAYGLPMLEPGSSLGPAGDRFFPERYLARARREAYRLGALRDASNVKGDEADSQVGRYGISLTVFAVAVFLFGYSLTPHARRRRMLFAGTATIAALGGVTWFTAVAVRAPSLPPVRAAATFADGRVAYDSEQYQLAVTDLTRSLRAWPDYAEAHILRARAEFAAGSPQLDIPLSLTAEPALARAVADEQRALELGAQDSGLIANAGYDLFALGLRRHSDALMKRGLELSRQAARSRPTDPVPAFNVAVTLLALDRPAQARAAYAEALTRTVYADRAHRVRRDDTAAYEFYLGEALTDLDSVATLHPALATAVGAIKAQIIAPITRASYGESLTGRRAPTASTGAVTLDVGPAFTRFTIIRPRGIGVNADLSAQWSLAAPGGLGWEVLPDVSGAVNNSVQEGSHGALFDREGFLAVTGSCLPPGRYRLELYVGAQRIADVARTIAFPTLVAGRLLDLGLDICRPAAWRLVANRAPGLLDGYRSADGKAGMVVFAVNRDIVGSARPSRALSRRIMAAAVARFAYALPPGLDAGRDASGSFMGLPDGLVRSFRYPGGVALAGAGAPSGTGQLLVAVMFGPQRFVAGHGRAVFASLASEG